MCALKWFAAMASHMDATVVEHFLTHILNPVYRVIEDDTIRDTQMGEWVSAWCKARYSD